ncbi:MAG: hypothetical protein QNJ38_21560 [Prochloraceae cyanobacterium]|nr:hypothetical protein [Prochloraceae cyanobacterium]
MSITVTGAIERSEIGVGTWGVKTEGGETYELLDPPDELLVPQAKVTIVGKVREDVMTIAMIGPVLEIESFQILEN